MTTSRKPAAPKLPPVTVMRLQALTTQIDAVVEENVDIFAARAGRYVDAFRLHSERDLAPDEVAQVAGAIGAVLGRTDVTELLSEVSASGLRTRTNPPRMEALLAAGSATAPAAIDAVLKFVALVELAPDEFEQASEADNLEMALVEPIRELKRLPLGEANTRARGAFEHLASEAGTPPGEAVSLILRALGTALSEAVGPLSQSGSVIGSLAHMGGADASASTESPGEKPGI
jgi:hypothetical protein